MSRRPLLPRPGSVTNPPWTVRYNGVVGERHEVCNVGEFDELVLSGVLHLEKMDDTAWWMQVGDAYVWIQLRRGKPPIVHVRRGEYGPAEGTTDVGRTVSPQTQHPGKRRSSGPK